MAFQILGFWSSIKPAGYETNEGSSTTNPPEQLDLRRDGLVEIRTFDEDTGRLEGFYTDVSDPDNPVTVRLTGQLRFIGTNTYTLVLTHVDPPGSSDKIVYEGQTVVLEEGDFPIFVVAGRFRRVHAADPAIKGNAMNGGQEEGVWVATKP